jgi:hypothetical protein
LRKLRPSHKAKVVRTFHAKHRRPVRDPMVRKYSRSISAKAKPAVLRSPRPPGKRNRLRRRYPHIPMIAPAPVSPVRRGGQGAFSTRYELYLYHKANGTLPEFYRMFGLDYVPE